MKVTKTINIKDFVEDTENYLKEIKSSNEPILIDSEKYCIVMTLKYFQNTIDESLRKGIELGKTDLFRLGELEWEEKQKYLENVWTEIITEIIGDAVSNKEKEKFKKLIIELDSRNIITINREII